jgi:hypothetical protein
MPIHLRKAALPRGQRPSAKRRLLRRPPARRLVEALALEARERHRPPRGVPPPAPAPAAGTTTPGGSSPSSPRLTPTDPKGTIGVSVRLVNREAEARSMPSGLGLVRGAREMATSPSPADL